MEKDRERGEGITYYHDGEEHDEPISGAEYAVAKVTCPRCGTEQTIRKQFGTRESKSCGKCDHQYLSSRAMLFGEGKHGIPFESSSDMQGLSPTEFQDEIRYIKECGDIREKAREASFKDIVLTGISRFICELHVALLPASVFISLIFYVDFVVKQFLNGGSILTSIALSVAATVGLYLGVVGVHKTLHYTSSWLVKDYVGREDVEPNGYLAVTFVNSYANTIIPLDESVAEYREETQTPQK